MRGHIKDRPKLCHLKAADTPWHPDRHASTRIRQLLGGRDFSTPFLHRAFPNDHVLRRELVPPARTESRPVSNHSRRLDLRGKLFLRVVRLARPRGVRRGVRAVGARGSGGTGDHPREHLRGHGDSTDGGAGAALERRRVSSVSSARLSLHPAAAEARLIASRASPRILVLHRFYTQPATHMSARASRARIRG